MFVAMPTAIPPPPLTSRLGNLAGSTTRLDGVAVVGGREVDGVLVDLAEQLHRQRRQPRLGVAHRRRAVVGVGGAEVPVAVDERVAQREVLGHAGQGVVDRLVAVGVELAHHVADGGGALLVLAVGPQAAGVHAVEDPAVHRLQAVARVGQGRAR